MEMRAPATPEQKLADLEDRLKATPRAARPLEHAALRHSIGLAYAELPSGDRHTNLQRAVASYRQALKLFGAQRFPVEHGRVQTALGAALRELGERDQAVEACARAVELLAGGQAPGDLGAALNNLGLTQSDLGRHEEAVVSLRQAVAVFTAAKESRQRPMALHNLGQAQAASGDHAGAVETYEQAISETDDESLPYQWALLQHARGVSLTALGEGRQAAGAFEAALGVFTRQRYPFPHALAKNNLGLAYAQLGDVTSLRRALAAYSDAVRLLDPRLHRPQWEQTYRNLELAESALEAQGLKATRTEHFVALLAEVDDRERLALLRRRLLDLLGQPDKQRDEQLAELDLAVLRLDEQAGKQVTATWLEVLMELPDDLLIAGLKARMNALAHLDDDEEREQAAETLERVISSELLAPQRIRVRDMLETMGYERP
ncbi:MAG TPA: tetratricopeptide repeat protein [Egibacteraceae bacterium]|jgi:tetratricopeptide (TPR) repeat protein|nr:tetratricopeptide repeat protein [Egibacteraceae bacterium]